VSQPRVDLEKQGWEYRFTASDPGLTEHVEQFRALGFEVHLERVGVDGERDASCSTCLQDVPVFAIWVRRR
jgi:hypothetical protein